MPCSVHCTFCKTAAVFKIRFHSFPNGGLCAQHNLQCTDNHVCVFTTCLCVHVFVQLIMNVIIVGTASTVEGFCYRDSPREINTILQVACSFWTHPVLSSCGFSIDDP